MLQYQQMKTKAVLLSTWEQRDAETIPYACNWLLLHHPLKSGSRGQGSITQSLTSGLLFAKALEVPREIHKEHYPVSYETLNADKHCNWIWNVNNDFKAR